MEHILYKSIITHLEKHNILMDYQHGFRKGRSCESQLLITIEDVAKQVDSGVQTDMIILDFTKAFDTVPHQRLIEKLEHYGVRGNIKAWISSWLTQRHQKVVVNGQQSKSVEVLSGVPQGTVLAPLLFLIYINDIGHSISPSSKLRLFADDTILYSPITSEQDTQTLQRDLHNLFLWTSKWQLSFNLKKCNVIRITRSISPIIFNYTAQGVPIPVVSHHPYLGVELSSNLRWDKHIQIITKKANQTLAFLRRNLGNCPAEVKVSVYKTLIRPHLEYASTVWDPFLVKDVLELEKIQRRAARWVKSCYQRQPGVVSNLLIELGWVCLQRRRLNARLITMWKAINNLISFPMPAHIKHKQIITRQYHHTKFIQPPASSNVYKYSFISRTIKDWNNLSNNVIEASSLNAFKREISDLVIDLN